LRGEASASVSVIICTRNRSAALSRTLECLSQAEIPQEASFEVIVVDNGSSDDTQAVVREFAVRVPFRVRCVAESRPGLSRARNSGIRASSGNLILFTDDDCLVRTDWIVVARRLLAGNPLRLIGGRVDLHNPEHLHLSVKSSGEQETLSCASSLLGFMHGANMAFGRGVSEQIGLFDERLGSGTRLKAAEDTDFVYRALSHGLPVTYEPDLVVRHDHGRSGLEEYYRCERGYAVGLGALAMKHALRGHLALAKVAYWELRSALRLAQSSPSHRRACSPKLGIVNGALRFLLIHQWRPAN
jgi:glycosyltransferase involved in cell wall biosynthesis